VKLDGSGKKEQTITYDPIIYKTLGDAPISLLARASSGLPIQFSLVSGPATIDGNIITLTGVGQVVVKAAQAGDATYRSAEILISFPVERVSTITKQWDKTIGGNNDDKISAMIAAADGGYILGGLLNHGTEAIKRKII
jgi:hypothetical protein